MYGHSTYNSQKLKIALSTGEYTNGTYSHSGILLSNKKKRSNYGYNRMNPKHYVKREEQKPLMKENVLYHSIYIEF